MEEDFPMIVFDDSSKKEIFEALGLKQEDEHLVDEEGSIQTNDQIEIIKSNEFGGVLKGSKVMIKKDSLDLARYFLNLA